MLRGTAGEPRIPHLARVQQEIREIFLNAQFLKPEGCTGPLLEAYLCPGFVLVLQHDEAILRISLAEDWTGIEVHSEVHLQVNNPDWERFRRWLWEGCYEEVRQVVASICKTLGISVPWPEPIETAGRKHFPGREPLETSPNLFLDLGLSNSASHIITGQTGSGKTAFAMRLALDTSTEGQSVLFVSTELTTASIVSEFARLSGSKLPPKLKVTTATSDNIGTVFKQCEAALGDRDVLILDSGFSTRAVGDMPKRLAMKTGTEVFLVLAAAKGINEDTCFGSLSPRTKKTIDAVYWTVNSGAPFKVVQHPNRGGSRILYVSPP